MDYSSFEKIIMKRACCFAIICSVVLIVSLLAICYIFKRIKGDKPMFFALLSLCVLTTVGSCVLGGNVVYSSAHDINNQAYIVYEGVFKVERDLEVVSGTCTMIFHDKEKTSLEMDAYVLDPGEYTGKIIYGEKTKIVLDVQVTQG